MKIASSNMLTTFAALVVFASIYFASMDAHAIVSMANVTTETTLVRTWLTLAGWVLIACAIIGGLYMAVSRSPFAGVAIVVLAVVCGTLFAAALA